MKDMMIAIFGASLMMISAVASSDMRMEANSNNTFCHAVRPAGFANGNDDNEAFLGGCEPEVSQNDDGTGNGDYIHTKKFFGALPFTGQVQSNGNGKGKGKGRKYVYTNSGAQSGYDCTMVDSNNTTYVAADWNLEYVVDSKKKTITYKLACRNGAQQ